MNFLNSCFHYLKLNEDNEVQGLLSQVQWMKVPLHIEGCTWLYEKQ